MWSGDERPLRFRGAGALAVLTACPAMRRAAPARPGVAHGAGAATDGPNHLLGARRSFASGHP